MTESEKEGERWSRREVKRRPRKCLESVNGRRSPRTKNILAVAAVVVAEAVKSECFHNQQQSTNKRTNEARTIR